MHGSAPPPVVRMPSRPPGAPLQIRLSSSILGCRPLYYFGFLAPNCILGFGLLYYHFGFWPRIIFKILALHDFDVLSGHARNYSMGFPVEMMHRASVWTFHGHAFKHLPRVRLEKYLDMLRKERSSWEAWCRRKTALRHA